MSAMHILILPSERYSPADDPMAGIFQHHQAQALKRSGHRVGILSMPNIVQVRLVKFIKNLLLRRKNDILFEDDDGMPVSKHPGVEWQPRLQRTGMHKWFMLGKQIYGEYVNKFGSPDIIHAHNARFAGILACYIKGKWKTPYVITEHSTFYKREKINKTETGLVQKAYENADMRIAVSPALGELLVQIFGSSFVPWKWVPNIIDHNFEDNNEKIIRNDGIFRFLNVGSLIERKGPDDLLKAFARKFTGRKDVQLRIGGDGPLREKLENIARELNSEKQVVFLGCLGRDEVLREMQECDAYVHSSHYETFGVVLIEALSCGKPVISTACDGPECIINKDNGVMVPIQDVIRLSEAMENMVENIGIYDRNTIRNDCLSKFGQKKIVSQLEEIYAEVLKR